MSHMRVLLCEDKYGGPFLRELTNRLKSNNVISRNQHVYATKFYGACNVKLERQLTVFSQNRTCHFTILVDSDGKDKAKIRNRVVQHVPPSLATVTRIIVFDYEIEDWICVSLGRRLNQRSADFLKRLIGYENHDWISYVQKLDFQRLQGCRSFCDFVNSLQTGD